MFLSYQAFAGNASISALGCRIRRAGSEHARRAFGHRDDSRDSVVKLGQYVIGRYRDSEANLRTTFHKICDRAGVVRFAKPFMTCRATRRNELEKRGTRNAALNAWFGHSKQVAEKYYERATEDDYRGAIDAAGAIWGQKWGQVLGNTEAHSATEDSEKPRKKTGVVLPRSPVGFAEYTPEVFKH